MQDMRIGIYDSLIHSKATGATHEGIIWAVPLKINTSLREFGTLGQQAANLASTFHVDSYFKENALIFTKVIA